MCTDIVKMQTLKKSGYTTPPNDPKLLIHSGMDTSKTIKDGSMQLCRQIEYNTVFHLNLFKLTYSNYFHKLFLNIFFFDFFKPRLQVEELNCQILDFYLEYILRY